MAAIALAFVLPPLLQSSPQGPAGTEDDPNQKEANVNIYRDQLSELETDLANGIVSPEQYQQDRDEIERRMLEDVAGEAVQSKRSKASPPVAPSRTPAYALALGIPLLAVAFYIPIGNRGALSGVWTQPAGSRAPAQNAPFAPGSQPGGQMTETAIAANVAKLAQRLEQNPGDVQGWIMLGRSYSNLEKYKEASDAFAKASALKPTDADLLSDYAFSLAMANGQKLQGRPNELISKALKLDPENPKALELAGSAAFEAKDYKQAIAYWQKLLQKSSGDAEVTQALTERINEAKSLAGK
jgi:cytochrome c-type biogenesis protein CcmH